MVLEVKGVTLGDEFTEHKEVSEKAFSPFDQRIFSLALWSSKGSELSVHRFHRNKASKQLHEIQL